MSLATQYKHREASERIVGMGLACLVVGLGIVVALRLRDRIPNASGYSPRPAATEIMKTFASGPAPANVTLALQVDCPWCKKSVPMYKELLQKYGNASVHFTVVMPQAVPEQKTYLASLDLPVSDAKQVDFAALGVPGTPTVMVLDKVGTFRCGWSGYMSDSDERRLMMCVDHVLAER